ncbi:MAG: hypothetical protein GY785_10415, partial [Gammaproteobacteria bacterium]|nr:hypothetical protein [Gammaproteobacteria bacterium]
KSHVDNSVARRHGITHSDVLKSYLGLLCIGKNDFEAINSIDSDFFFQSALDVDEIPSEATLRQRMDRYATKFLPIVKKASWDFLKNSQPEFKPLGTGHIPLDADVTPMDNSRTRKEGVSRTYKGCDGFAPMAVYLATRVVRTARYLKLVFGKRSRAVDAFTEVYEKLAYGKSVSASPH